MNRKKITVAMMVFLLSRTPLIAQKSKEVFPKYRNKSIAYANNNSTYLPKKNTFYFKNKPLKNTKKVSVNIIDTLETKKKPVKLSLLSNYYEQDGNRSAVNGGVGSQELHSYTNEIYLTVPTSKQLDVRTDFGYDEFTSASYLDIDKYQTSASSGGSALSIDETRIYGNIGVDVTSISGNTLFSGTLGLSKEYDVTSKSLSLKGAFKNKKTGAVLSIKSTTILDKWLLIYPGEFRSYGEGLDGATGASDKGTKLEPNVTKIPLASRTETKDGKTYGVDDRLTSALGINYAFTINKRMNALVGLDYIYQTGLLSTPFYRVYFNDGVTDEYTKAAKVENLPDQKIKFALYGRYNYFFSNRMILRTSARLYHDDWGVKAVSLEGSLPVKLSSWISIAPFYRFHTQSAATYFKGYGHHNLDAKFYTSDFDLANIHSNKYGGSVRILPIIDFLKIKSFEIRYANYKRSDGLQGSSISGGLNFEF